MHEPVIKKSVKDKILGFFDRRISEQQVETVKSFPTPATTQEFSDSDLAKKLKEFVQLFHDNNIVELMRDHSDSPSNFANTPEGSNLLRKISEIEKIYHVVSRSGKISDQTAKIHSLFDRIANHNDFIRAAGKHLPSLDHEYDDSENDADYQSVKIDTTFQPQTELRFNPEIIKMAEEKLAPEKYVLNFLSKVMKIKDLKVDSNAVYDKAENELNSQKEKKSWTEKVKNYFSLIKEKYFPTEFGRRIHNEIQDPFIDQKESSELEIGKRLNGLMSDEEFTRRQFINMAREVLGNEAFQKFTQIVNQPYLAVQNMTPREKIQYYRSLGKAINTVTGRFAQKYDIVKTKYSSVIESIKYNTVKLGGFTIGNEFNSIIDRAFVEGNELCASNPALQLSKCVETSIRKGIVETLNIYLKVNRSNIQNISISPIARKLIEKLRLNKRDPEQSRLIYAIENENLTEDIIKPLLQLLAK